MTTPGRFVLSAIDPVIQASGSLAQGATCSFFLTGTTTLATVYTDSTLVTPVANPQAGPNASNAGGRFYTQTTEFWADASVAYDVFLQMPDGEQYTYSGLWLSSAPVNTSGFLQNPNVMLTGVPTAPTPAANDSSSKIATTAFVQQAIMLAASSFVQPGFVFGAFAPMTVAGWALLNGAAISRTSNPTLFSLYGTAFGAGDGSTTFNLPNTQGYFPRGANPAGTGPGPTTTTGTTMLDAFQGFLMAAPVSGTSGSYTDGFLTRIASYPAGGTVSSISLGAGGWDVFGKTGAPVTDGTNGTPRTATETRPAFIAQYWYVKLG
jgi:hypothetical protein